MDTNRFDGLTRTLAATGSRRRVLAALAGGLFAALSGRQSGVAADKVTLCHRTGSDTSPIVVIEVSVDAVADHLAHGDFYYDSCCVDGDCGPGLNCESGFCDNGDGMD